MGLLIVAVIIGSAVWVFIDARRVAERMRLPEGPMEQPPVAWALSVLLLWIVCFPLYLVERGKALSGSSGGIGVPTANRKPLVLALALLLLLPGAIMLLVSLELMFSGVVDWVPLLIGASLCGMGVGLLRL